MVRSAVNIFLRLCLLCGDPRSVDTTCAAVLVATPVVASASPGNLALYKAQPLGMSFLENIPLLA